ncbi:programmed cell death toxin MazF [Paucilactobacillus hokkaidonensis JCM 18461]|uniref:Programmed cell death toxin MazF n=2 Tax=Paucilactobacillus hokkaidonensis TaxID=1193095 RepID=A0A0A1H0U7_9LACO|nr:type II toxin-antitoxin system PemK/MazF family toxin [Paucilactobacillus hokkaidonensis]KRO10015.1 hypothetical protein IV59_GL002216 [Paucilactobacillus hokkaidonensis]BAP86331.1 programmed cell death toxin MazF [Paucilactobacillus hokkaidonensis JCM 18461]
MSGTDNYIPDKGDLVLINFNPSMGHEIQKYRPAMVISNSRYTEMTGLALVCPITHADHNRLSKIGLLIKISTNKISGFVNPLQFHTFDYRKRDMQFIAKADKPILMQAMQTINDIVNAKD